jgi:TonB family protein
MLQVINSFAEHWMEYLGTAILQNTIFLSVIFLVLYLLREKHAGIKYAVAALGLIKLLVPPFVPITVRESLFSAPLIGSISTGDISVEAVADTVSTTPITFLGVLFLIWAVTVILMFGSSLLSTLRLKWHLRDASFVKHVEIDGKAVDIYSSLNISVPMSVGLFPKRVYVPTLWSSLTDNLQYSLLRHEVAHIKRRDGLLGALQMLAQALYFFHPLVWILTRQANEFREMACDDMAVDNSEVTPLVYSRCLVHVAEHMLPSWSCSSASTLIKQKNKLYSRVNYQVKETKMKKLSKNRSRLIWTLLLVLIVPLSWYCKQPDSAVGIKDADTGKIYGKIINTKTGEPIAGANIIVFNTPLGAASNEKGEYFITGVEPGRRTIRCSVIGYSEVVINNLKIPKGKTVPLNFQMKLSSINTQKVVVTAKPLKASKPPIPVKPAETEGKNIEFVPYDIPPLPIGGETAIAKNIRYPELAKKAGIEGTVIVQAKIGIDGHVEETKILKGIPNTGLDKAAEEAIKQVKFHPAKQRDKEVAVWVSLPVRFKLKKTEPAKNFVPYDQPPVPVDGMASIAKYVVYPEKAKEAGIEGTVLVQARVGIDGHVEETQILKGVSTGLNKAAEEAIKQVKFHPAKQRDKKVAVWITIPVEFRLEDEKE